MLDGNNIDLLNINTRAEFWHTQITTDNPIDNKLNSNLLFKNVCYITVCNPYGVKRCTCTFIRSLLCLVLTVLAAWNSDDQMKQKEKKNDTPCETFTIFEVVVKYFKLVIDAASNQNSLLVVSSLKTLQGGFLDATLSKLWRWRAKFCKSCSLSLPMFLTTIRLFRKSRILRKNRQQH